MKHLIFTLLCASASVLSLRAQDTLRLSLQSAIATAVEHSIESKVAKNQLLSAYWAYRTYQREMLPVLTFDGMLPEYSQSLNLLQHPDGTTHYVNSNFNRFNAGLSLTQNIPWTGATLSVSTTHEQLQQFGDNPFTRYRTTPLSVILNQPLFAFNSLRWLQKTEPLRYHAALKQAVINQEEVALRVISYYFALLSEEINLEIARQNMENAQRLYTIAEARHRMGQLPNVELMQMRSSLLRAEITLTNTQYALENRMFNLRSFLGLGEGVIILPIIPELTAESIPHLNFNEVLELAQENNPFTENVQRSLIEADRDVRRAKANRWNASLYAAFGVSGQSPEFRAAYQSNLWDNDQIVRLGIRVPILDWGRNKGQVKMAEAHREIAYALAERDNLDFVQDAYLRVQNFNNQPRQLELAKYMDEIAQERYKTSVELYVFEKIDILNLNDAERAKDEARRGYISEMFLLWSYYYQIRTLTLYDFVNDSPVALVYDFREMVGE